MLKRTLWFTVGAATATTAIVKFVPPLGRKLAVEIGLVRTSNMTDEEITEAVKQWVADKVDGWTKRAERGWVMHGEPGHGKTSGWPKVRKPIDVPKTRAEADAALAEFGMTRETAEEALAEIERELGAEQANLIRAAIGIDAP